MQPLNAKCINADTHRENVLQNKKLSLIIGHILTNLTKLRIEGAHSHSSCFLKVICVVNFSEHVKKLELRLNIILWLAYASHNRLNYSFKKVAEHVLERTSRNWQMK